MTLHSSLKSADKKGAQKSVLSRMERIKLLVEKGKKIDEVPVFGLPKIKVAKVKIKKTVKEEKKEEETKQG